jgi:hypothetical protein
VYGQCAEKEAGRGTNLALTGRVNEVGHLVHPSPPKRARKVAH